MHFTHAPHACTQASQARISCTQECMQERAHLMNASHARTSCNHLTHPPHARPPCTCVMHAPHAEVVTVSGGWDWEQSNYDREFNSNAASCINFMLASSDRLAATFVYSDSGNSDASTCYAFKAVFDCNGGSASTKATSFIHCNRVAASCPHCTGS